jgi:hypothetical protein
MKRYMALCAVPFLALAACGDDGDNGGGGGDAADTGGGGGGDTGGGTPGTSALTGVNVNVQVNTPTPNAACDASEVDNVQNGAKYPWGGLTAGGTAYTCNKCPTGLSFFQGKWRAHGFTEDGTPDYTKLGDASTGDAEALYIDGNTWYSHFRDQQDNQSVETRGWFFCSQQPEHPNEHLFWVTLQATPAGNLGANAGDINESDVILPAGADNQLIAWYDEIGGETSVSIGYCKIGSVRAGVTCNDPFE